MVGGIESYQQSNGDFSSSARLFPNEKKPRHCQASFFEYTHKLTGQRYNRKWLCYSQTIGCLFCLPCKVMASQSSISSSEDKLVSGGFNDWKHCADLLHRHESKASHKEALLSIATRQKMIGCINTQLSRQVQDEMSYWQKLIQRIIDIVSHAVRGMLGACFVREMLITALTARRHWYCMSQKAST